MPDSNPATQTSNFDEIFLADVVGGLSASNKSIPSKYFYDQRGSELFNEICKLDEYYLTRAELEVMQSHASEMARQLDTGVRLIEYGSGSSVKTELLLDQLIGPAAYVPIDISANHLLVVTRRLAEQYPHIEISPLVADFTRPVQLPQSNVSASHDAVYFPGSTIGNFEPSAALEILQQIADLVCGGGGLLIGIDLHKNPEVIQRAYNDSKGITAAFNKNLLVHVNRNLGADFDVSAFQHYAIYNATKHRIETSLVSQTNQTVTINGNRFTFEAGEHLHTEYSYKYTIDGFADFVASAGFELHKYWVDSRRLFGVVHLVVAPQGRRPVDRRKFVGPLRLVSKTAVA